MDARLTEGCTAQAGPKLTPDGVAFPLIIVCNAAPTAATFNTHDWVTNNQAELERLLDRHGAIVFRGFHVKDAVAFGSFISGFVGWQDLPYEDSLSLAVRLPVCDRVCTTNEGKTGGIIWHHEQASAPRYPSKVFFYCEVPAAHGGATGVTPSWAVHDALARKYPDFLAECVAKGIVYRLSLPEIPDSGSGVGRSWKRWGTLARTLNPIWDPRQCSASAIIQRRWVERV
jgi:hypothetical protein